MLSRQYEKVTLDSVTSTNLGIAMDLESINFQLISNPKLSTLIRREFQNLTQEQCIALATMLKKVYRIGEAKGQVLKRRDTDFK